MPIEQSMKKTYEDKIETLTATLKAMLEVAHHIAWHAPCIQLQRTALHPPCHGLSLAPSSPQPLWPQEHEGAMAELKASHENTLEKRKADESRLRKEEKRRLGLRLVQEQMQRALTRINAVYMHTWHRKVAKSKGRKREEEAISRLLNQEEEQMAALKVATAPVALTLRLTLNLRLSKPNAAISTLILTLTLALKAEKLNQALAADTHRRHKGMQLVKLFLRRMVLGLTVASLDEWRRRSLVEGFLGQHGRFKKELAEKYAAEASEAEQVHNDKIAELEQWHEDTLKEIQVKCTEKMQMMETQSEETIALVAKQAELKMNKSITEYEEQIANLHRELKTKVAHYEDRVADLTQRLQQLGVTSTSLEESLESDRKALAAVKHHRTRTVLKAVGSMLKSHSDNVQGRTIAYWRYQVQEGAARWACSSVHQEVRRDAGVRHLHATLVHIMKGLVFACIASWHATAKVARSSPALPQPSP